MRKLLGNPRASLRVLFLALALLSLTACGTGSVYFGVGLPGPWVRYPPGVYGGRPGYYGRPWYAPDQEQPQQEIQEVAPGPEEGAEGL